MTFAIMSAEMLLTSRRMLVFNVFRLFYKCPLYVPKLSWVLGLQSQIIDALMTNIRREITNIPADMVARVIAKFQRACNHRNSGASEYNVRRDKMSIIMKQFGEKYMGISS